MTSVEERGEEPHRLRVVKSGPGNVHKVEIDGHVVMPTSMTVEFLEAAEYVIAKMTLPCFVENLDALTVLDISLDEPQRPERDEC